MYRDLCLGRTLTMDSLRTKLLPRFGVALLAFIGMTPPGFAQSWVDNNLSVLAAHVSRLILPVPNSPLTADFFSDQQHVNYFTLVNNQWHVAELLSLLGNQQEVSDGDQFWTSSDVTAGAVHGTAAAPGSAIHRYWTNSSDQHVNFFDGNGHVHELFITFSNKLWAMVGY